MHSITIRNRIAACLAAALPFAALLPAAAGDIDDETLAQAAASYAGEISTLMNHWVADQLYGEGHSSAELQQIADAASQQVAECVVEDLAERDDRELRAYLLTLADAQTDAVAATMLRRDYSSNRSTHLTDSINEAAEACMTDLPATSGWQDDADQTATWPDDAELPTDEPPGNLDLIYESNPEVEQRQ